MRRKDVIQLSRPFDPRVEHFAPLPRQTFKEMLGNIRGVQFITVITRTVPDMRATGNPYWGQCWKIARRNVITGNVQYEKMMRRELSRLQKEGYLPANYNPNSFKAKPRTWGARIRGTPFVRHFKSGVELLAVETVVINELAHEYQTSGGRIIPDENISKYIRDKVFEPVCVRDYYIQHIIAVVMGEHGYIIQ